MRTEGHLSGKPADTSAHARISELIPIHGEMAQLVRDHDWGSTPLGPIESWPDTLLSTVNLVLASPFSSSLFWGPELIFIYNDAYRPLVSIKHPGCLGAQGPDVWKEAWATVGPEYNSVLHQGKSVYRDNVYLPIEKDGKLRDFYFIYTLTPVYDRGRIVGVYNRSQDTTAAVLAEREREKLTSQLMLAMESAGQGAWFYDSESLQVVGDEGMCRIFDARREGGPVDYWLNLVHPEDRERVASQFATGITREHPYDSEYRVGSVDNFRWVRSKGRLVGDGTTLTRIFGVAEDITLRKQAELANQLAKTRQEIQLRLLQEQRRTTDAAAMMHSACEAIGLHLEVDRVGFFEMLDEDTLDFDVGWTNGVLPLLKGPFPAIALGPGYLAEVREGKVDGIDDVQNDPRTAGSLFESIGTRSLIGVPILRNGQWIAGMYVNHSQPRHWTREEIDFACDVGEQAWDAVERARVQRSLHASEERLRLALAAGKGIGTWDWDVVNDLVYADPIFARTYGVDPGRAAKGAPVEDFLRNLHPVDRGRLEAELTRAVKTGDFFSSEYRLLSDDGAVRWVSAQGRCTLAPDGSPVRFPGITFDITDRKQADQALRSSEERFRTLFELTPVGVAMTDAINGQILLANDEMCRITGYPHDELQGMTSQDFTHPGDQPANEDLYRRVLFGQLKTGVVEKRYIQKNGSVVWVRVTIRSLVGPDHANTYILGAVENITESRQAQEALRASEEQLRQILSSTRDRITVLDLNGNILSMNIEGQTRLGIDNFEQLRGSSWSALWSSEENLVAAEAMHNALQGGSGSFEAALTTPNGEETWWDITVTPIRDAKGQIVQLLAVSREITSKKRTEAALRQSEKLAAVGRLASTIAHEINNPLESVTNLLYLAHTSDNFIDVQSFIATAERELRRVSVIASQTLRFHKQPKDPRPVTADDLLETVLSIYHGRLVNYRIQVERRRNCTTPITCFDGEIRQVLNNLVANAIDAMSATGGRIILSCHQSTNWKTGASGLAITVADTGKGMSPETSKKVFEAFFTTKGIGGAGLGLWLSKDIVERHRGRLRFHSSQRPNRSGTAFTLFLPFEAARRPSQ